MIIRIGNDVKGLQWNIQRRVLVNGFPTYHSVDFRQCLEVTLMIFNSKIRTDKIDLEFSLLEGAVLLNIPANSITQLGSYNLVLEYKVPDPSLSGGIGTHTLDWKDAFTIVASSDKQDTSGNTNTSFLNYSIDGKTAYDYWLEYNTGTVEDYVNWQQRPAVVAALRVESYITNAQQTINDLSDRINGLQSNVSTLMMEPGEIQQFESYLNFPNLGNASVLYIDTNEDTSYRWDAEELKYYIINPIDIQIINGN